MTVLHLWRQQASSLLSMSSDESGSAGEPGYQVAVIGAGPRGTSLLERLLAHCEQHPAAAEDLSVLVCEPAEPGCGAVWEPGQSPLYLMNTPAEFPTAAPTGDTTGELPASSCAMSFLQWSQRTGGHWQPGDYPTRADYGRYLSALFTEVCSGLRALGVRVDLRRSHVTALTPVAQGWRLQTEDGQAHCRTAVLCLGHIPARLDAARADLAAHAEQHGLHYSPPAIPTRAGFEDLPAGEPVLVRGMGLNFFDLMIATTAGRGGVFHTVEDAPAGHRLRYAPSGAEPHLIAGARRGVPYRGKSVLPGFVPAGITLRHTTDAILQNLTGSGVLDDAAVLWDMLTAEVTEHYQRYGGTGEFTIRNYAHPFLGHQFTTGEDYQQAAAEYLVADAAACWAGQASAEKMAVGALHAARLQIKAWISEGRISDEVRVHDVEGTLEPLVEGLASGPPVQRIEELAALARAGVVTFLGPAAQFSVDDAAGVFTARSPQVQNAVYRARHLVEAMMPPNRVTLAEQPLVRGLLDAGEVTPAVLAGEEHKGFAVTTRPHRPLNAAGAPTEGLLVLGLQLSSAQWGTAIAAEASGSARTTASTLADAHAAAGYVIGAGTRRGASG